MTDYNVRSPDDYLGGSMLDDITRDVIDRIRQANRLHEGTEADDVSLREVRQSGVKEGASESAPGHPICPGMERLRGIQYANVVI